MIFLSLLSQEADTSPPTPPNPPPHPPGKWPSPGSTPGRQWSWDQDWLPHGGWGGEQTWQLITSARLVTALTLGPACLPCLEKGPWALVRKLVNWEVNVSSDLPSQPSSLGNKRVNWKRTNLFQHSLRSGLPILMVFRSFHWAGTQSSLSTSWGIRGGALSDSALGNEVVFALSPWNKDEGQGPVCGGGRWAREPAAVFLGSTLSLSTLKGNQKSGLQGKI